MPLLIENNLEIKALNKTPMFSHSLLLWFFLYLSTTQPGLTSGAIKENSMLSVALSIPFVKGSKKVMREFGSLEPLKRRRNRNDPLLDKGVVLSMN